MRFPNISLKRLILHVWSMYYLIFSRNYSQFLEKKINNHLNKDAYITHKLENKYFFPIQDKKIVVAKLGKDFSWFSFVTLFITFYGISLYVYGTYNIILVTLNNIYFFMFIIFLTLVTFAVGYWWFINNEGEARLSSVYDE